MNNCTRMSRMSRPIRTRMLQASMIRRSRADAQSHRAIDQLPSNFRIGTTEKYRVIIGGPSPMMRKKFKDLERLSVQKKEDNSPRFEPSPINIAVEKRKIYHKEVYSLHDCLKRQSKTHFVQDSLQRLLLDPLFVKSVDAQSVEFQPLA